MRTRVVVVDDQPLVRAGLRTVLETEPDLEVAGEAADGRAALDAVRALRPDVVLMDVRMPVLDGIAATRALAAADGPPVLVLTTYDADEYVFAALRAGASGFLLKHASPEELVAAVRTVARGRASSRPPSRAASSPSSPPVPLPRETTGASPRSPRGSGRCWS